MTTAISRRGLFRAFRPIEDRDHAAASALPAQLARVTAACVEPKGVTCRRCGDECEAGAIRFRLIGRGRADVLVDQALCTGCGSCLSVCPTHGLELVNADRATLVAGLVALEAGQ